MFKTTLVVLIVFFAATSSRADIVTLIDGRTVEGDIVAESPTDVTVRISVGKAVLKREEILKIEHTKSPSALLREKMSALEKKNAAADDWLKLGAEAKHAGAQDEALAIYKKVVALDNENETANLALGHVKIDGRWAEKSGTDKANARAESAAKASAGQNATPMATDAAGGMTTEKLAKMAGVSGFSPANEKPVDCPNCHGTGIAIVLECLNCNKSGRPGYKNLGDHFEVDQRCGGTGKVVGLYCSICNKTGKVLLSRITPANGGVKPAPAGYKWCPQCSATGYETWLPCNQCKRSKYPGYSFFGDRLEPCNRCGGAGKMPGIPCSLCNKRCIVPDK